MGTAQGKPTIPSSTPLESTWLLIQLWYVPITWLDNQRPRHVHFSRIGDTLRPLGVGKWSSESSNLSTTTPLSAHGPQLLAAESSLHCPSILEPHTKGVHGKL